MLLMEIYGECAEELELVKKYESNSCYYMIDPDFLNSLNDIREKIDENNARYEKAKKEYYEARSALLKYVKGEEE